VRTVFAVAIMAITSFLGTPDQAQASLCGASRCCLRAARSSCCTPSYCTVMKTVQETVYDERTMDVYHVEYGEVKDKVKIPVVKYKEGTAYRCCCVTVLQLPPLSNCPPVKTCAPAADCTNSNCGSGGCPELVPVQVLKKCPYTTMHEVIEEEEIERTRLTCKLIKEEIMVCVPRVVCKQVPVQVCCPTPCCRRCVTAPAPAPNMGCGK